MPYYCRSIGWPMIQAGLSTVLCVSPLLLVDSYMVSVFLKTIFLVISLGLLHGILFLPSLLLTVTPLNITKKKIQNEPGKKLKTHMVSINDVNDIKSKFDRMISLPPLDLFKAPSKILHGRLRNTKSI